jgi:hypothetical protein
MKIENTSGVQWTQSPIDANVIEMSGNLAFVPTKNKFWAMKNKQANKVGFTFEETPINPEGSFISALFIDAIFLLFNDEDDDFVENKIELYKADNGNYAFGLRGSKHTYFLNPIKVSENDNRIAAMTFWREPLLIC